MKKVIAIVLVLLLGWGIAGWLHSNDVTDKEQTYGVVYYEDGNSSIRVKQQNSDEYEVFVCTYDSDGVVKEARSVGIFSEEDVYEGVRIAVNIL